MKIFRTDLSLFTIMLLMCCNFLHGQSSFYSIQDVQQIEISFPFSNWDYRLDTAKLGRDGYTIAGSIKINGITYENVGIKYKGNSSFDTSYIKNPFHIKLDYLAGQDHEGYKDIKLSNCFADPSMIREVLAYQILSNYMKCGGANFAKVFVNGSFLGLYTNTEDVGKQFCLSNFNSKNNTLIKCNPLINPGPANKSSLRYLSADSSLYFNLYKVQSGTGWNELVELCNQITNYPQNIATVINIDRSLWMLAFNNILVNLDSYSGAFGQNYYIYRGYNDKFNVIVWDLNMAFGGFPHLGSGATSMVSLGISDLQQMPLIIHANDPYWPLIKALMANDTYKRMYIAHCKTIGKDFFENGLYIQLCQQLMNLIDTIVLADANKFFSYNEFVHSLDQQVQHSSYYIPGIRQLMDERIGFLNSTAFFQNTSPAISDIQVVPQHPQMGQIANFSVQVTDASEVYLGYCDDIRSGFSLIPMYDDGNHGDGNSGDGIWGCHVTVGSGQIYYYFYAQNNNAGMFSPERAEHEYYSLYPDVHQILPGQLVINEIMADNKTYEFNEYLEYTDWIEFHNTTENSLDLSGMYLSDSYAEPLKFRFPAETIIPPRGYAIVWADNESSSEVYLHANFSLDKDGEKLILSNPAGMTIDSVRFGKQYQDESWGRCPDGNGLFMTLYFPSFMASNCITDIGDPFSPGLNIFPNPASDIVTIQHGYSDPVICTEIFSSDGKLLLRNYSGNNLIQFDISNFSSGLYIISVKRSDGRRIMTKIIKE